MGAKSCVTNIRNLKENPWSNSRAHSQKCGILSHTPDCRGQDWVKSQSPTAPVWKDNETLNIRVKKCFNYFLYMFFSVIAQEWYNENVPN